MYLVEYTDKRFINLENIDEIEEESNGDIIFIVSRCTRRVDRKFKDHFLETLIVFNDSILSKQLDRNIDPAAEAYSLYTRLKAEKSID